MTSPKRHAAARRACHAAGLTAFATAAGSDGSERRHTAERQASANAFPADAGRPAV